MSLTLLSRPQIISPVYNPNWWVFRSNQTGQLNFNYVLDFYDQSNNQRMIRVRVPGEPLSGDCVYNVEKVLQTYVNQPFLPALTGFTCQDYIQYYIQGGEAYTQVVNITNNFCSGGTAGFTVVAPHPFQPGDFVTINQTGTPTNPQYNGTFLVLSTSATQVVVNVPCGTPSSDTGSMVLSNSGTTIFPNLISFSGNVSHNAAIDTIDWLSYDFNDYIPDTITPGLWYTDAYQEYQIRIENQCYIGLIDNFSTSISTFHIETTDINGTVEEFTYSLSAYSGCQVSYFGVGPVNLLNNPNITPLVGALPVIKPTTDTYRIWIETGTTRVMDIFDFKMYEFCHKWDNFEFLFMDRKGSWFPINMELVQRKNINSNRTTYKKGLGTYNPSTGRISYNSYDRGTKVVKNDVIASYRVSSNWMNEQQSLYFEQFLTSPRVYWNYKGTGVYMPINITSLNQEIKDKKNTRLINYEISFEVANNVEVQITS
jgi:hypothetical protein